MSERELAHLWQGQRFPPAALNTRDGQWLIVVYRGRAGGGAGPDFRDAVVAAPWGLLRGDVELHVRSSDFRRHGHGRDPAYDRLALHVVFWDDEGQDTLLAGGRQVAVAALAPWAERQAQEIRRWLERPPLWEEPCRSALRRLGADAVAAALDEAGDSRFHEKTEALRALLRQEAPDEVVWRGLLEALGYGGDRAAFRDLALRLPWRRISAKLCRLPASQRLAEARRLLLAAADLPQGRSARGDRPGNEAWRRLEGAARLAVRFCQGGLAASLEAALSGAGNGAGALVAALSVADGREAVPSGRQAPSAGSGQALRPGSPSETSESARRTGQSASGGSGHAFIGRGRALEMIANVVLPYAAARGDAGLARAAAVIYALLPLPARYGAVRHLHQAVGRGVPLNMRRQQGMLHLLRQECSQGGCGRCPLS